MRVILVLFSLLLQLVHSQLLDSNWRQHRFVPEKKLYLKHVVGLNQELQFKVDTVSPSAVEAHPELQFDFTKLEELKGYTTSQLTDRLNAKDKFGFNANKKLRQTILGLAYMAEHAYKKLPKTPWEDLGSGWKVNSTFGWDNTTVRGYVFSNNFDNSLVVAYKGTSFSFLGGHWGTVPNDKVSDNLMFSCCCGGTNGNWRQICSCARDDRKCSSSCLQKHTLGNATYYHAAQLIFDSIQQRYPQNTFILTGHSLGGSLAALVGTNSNIPAVTFEAPGEKLYAYRSGILQKRKPQSLLIHFGVNSDPIFMGTCNGVFSSCYLAGYGMDSKCHTSDRCTFDTETEFGWLESILHHRSKQLLNRVFKPWADGEAFQKNFFCSNSKNCTDCPSWEFIK